MAGPSAASKAEGGSGSSNIIPTQPLSFPPSHYAKIAPADFLHASLTSSSTSGSSGSSTGVRPNGRLATQIRDASINAGSLTNANGSAVVRLGSTSVVCGVRAELLPVSHIHGGLPSDLESWQASAVGASGVPSRPSPEDNASIRSDADILADLRLLVPNLELSTGCNPAHLPGNAPAAEAQGLTLRILALLRTADLVGLAPLLVWHRPELSADADGAGASANPNDPEGDLVAGDEMATDEATEGIAAAEWQIKAIWTLYVDILYISLDGAAFDAAWLAVLAALRDTKLPAARWDPDREALLCSPLRADAAPLQLGDLPVPLTAGLFTHGSGPDATLLLYDTDDFEESVCQGSVSVVVAAAAKQKGKGKGGRAAAIKARLLRAEVTGKGGDVGAVAKVAKGAEERWKAWQKLLAWE